MRIVSIFRDENDAEGIAQRRHWYAPQTLALVHQIHDDPSSFPPLYVLTSQ